MNYIIRLNGAMRKAILKGTTLHISSPPLSNSYVITHCGGTTLSVGGVTPLGPILAESVASGISSCTSLYSLVRSGPAQGSPEDRLPHTEFNSVIACFRSIVLLCPGNHVVMTC